MMNLRRKSTSPIWFEVGYIKDEIVEDEVPPAPITPKSKKGDLYELGKHRLLCGDSTKKEDVESLMNGRKADLVVTSPPYFNQRQYSTWKTYEDYCAFIKQIVGSILLVSSKRIVVCWNIGNDVAHHLDMPAHQSQMFTDSQFTFIDEICWKKAGAVYSIPRSAQIRTNNYFYPALAWEPIKIFNRGGLPKFEPADEEINSSFGTNHWEINQVVGSSQSKIGHTALFPVELVQRCITAYSNLINKNVFEPFCGGGTTLIASEQTGRICYAMEIEPIYCDVIVTRYCNLVKDNKIKLNGKEIDWQPQELKKAV
jgi:DNA modification methylase